MGILVSDDVFKSELVDPVLKSRSVILTIDPPNKRNPPDNIPDGYACPNTNPDLTSNYKLYSNTISISGFANPGKNQITID